MEKYKELIFYPVKIEDISYLLDLRKRTMNEHLKNENMPTDDKSHLKRIKYHFENGFIIFNGEKRVGFLKYVYEERKIYLVQIQVEPTYQGKGFGNEVLEFLVDKSDKLKFGMHLEVLKKNPAKKLYEKFGFKITGEDESSYEMNREAKI